MKVRVVGTIITVIMELFFGIDQFKVLQIATEFY